MPKGWGLDKPLMVYVDRVGTSIVGPNVNEYKTTIGCLARNGMRLPLHYKSFNLIPEPYRKGAWLEVQASTKMRLSSLIYKLHLKSIMEL